MKASEFILDTLSYYVKEQEGPPPGIPRHTDEIFERSLADQCINQKLAPVVAATLSKLALPPNMSRITQARFDSQCEQIARSTNHRLALLGRISRRLQQAGLRNMVMGDGCAAVSLYPHPEQRAVPALELLVDERDRARVLDVMATMGFRPPYAYPNFSGGREALRYHQYFEPLMLADDEHDLLRLRFRLVDFARAENVEPAWDRGTTHRISNKDLHLISREDHLIHSLVRFQSSRMCRLLDAVDAGFIVASAATLDWNYIQGRMAAKGLQSSLCLCLDRVCRLFKLPDLSDELPAPRTPRRWFEFLWRPDRADYAKPIPPRDGVISYYFWAVRGPWRRLVLLWRSITPEESWMASFYGPLRHWWNRFMLYRDIHTRRQHVLRSVTRPRPGEVTAITSHSKNLAE